jgi:hypothetical protein
MILVPGRSHGGWHSGQVRRADECCRNGSGDPSPAKELASAWIWLVGAGALLAGAVLAQHEPLL